VHALRERHEAQPTGHRVPAELVGAVGRQGADDEATVAVEPAAARGRRTTIRGLVLLFFGGRVDERLAALLVPRLEVLAAPCCAAVEWEDGVGEAGPVDGYAAGLEATGVVCVDPGAQGATAVTECIWSV